MLPSEENALFSIFIPNSFTILFSPQNKKLSKSTASQNIPKVLRKYAARVFV